MAMNPRLLRPLARLQAGTPASLLLHFDGNFTDSSPSNLTVTAEGEAATSTTQSKFGGASGYFDGDGDRLDIATGGVLAFGADDFTVELWCYFAADENNGENVLFSQASPDDAVGVALAIYDNDLMWLAGVASSWEFQRYPGNGDFAAGSVVAGEWNHIAVTRSGDTFRLFANGQLLDSYTASLTLPDSNALASIGGRDNFGQYFTGYIDDLRIVKGMAVYTGPFVPPTGPLSAYATPVPVSREASLLLRFDGNFTDSSVNGLAVTAEGGATTSTAQSKWGGGSGYFDGVGAYAETTLPDFVGADFTIEMWMRRTGAGSGGIQTFVDLGDIQGGQGGLNLFTDSSGVFSWDDGLTAAIVGGEAPVDQWVHVAAVRSGGVNILYIDGESVGASTQDFSAAVVSNVARIGAAPNYGFFWEGYIDDLRIVKDLAVYEADFHPPTAPLAALAVPCTNYRPPKFYFNAAVDSDWNTLGNWWTSVAFTTQASALPTSGDSVVLSATCDTNSGSAPTVVNFTLNDPGSNSYYIAIPFTVTGDATFNGTSFTYDTLTGNATFNNSSRNNLGTVSGNATFNDSSYNDTGNVGGNATFNNSSYNGGGTVSGNATFNDSSYNDTGIVGGNATFNDSAHNSGNVIGNATFNDSSYNIAIVTLDATFNDNSYNDGTVTLDATFNDTSRNNSAVTGDATFNDNAYNDTGTVSGNATFNGSSYNYYLVTGNATFNDNAYNNGGALVGGNATFNNSSYNSYATVSGDATFNNSSYNSGTVESTATFNNSSYNSSDGIVTGTATFTGSACNDGGTAGTFVPNPPPSCP